MDITIEGDNLEMINGVNSKVASMSLLGLILGGIRDAVVYIWDSEGQTQHNSYL